MNRSGKTSYAFAIGSLISGIGWFSIENGNAAILGSDHLLGGLFAVLSLPSLLFGLIANGNFHDPNMLAAAIANALLYGFIVRFILLKFWKGSSN